MQIELMIVAISAVTVGFLAAMFVIIYLIKIMTETGVRTNQLLGALATEKLAVQVIEGSGDKNVAGAILNHYNATNKTTNISTDEKLERVGIRRTTKRGSGIVPPKNTTTVTSTTN